MRRMDGTFLHSPLLDELKSLETMLMRKAYRQQRAALKRDEGSTGSRVAVEEALAKKPSCKVELPNQVCDHVCWLVSSFFSSTPSTARP